MRTEEEIITQAPLEIVLGGVAYRVKPLVIKDSREWRRKVANLLGGLPKYTSMDSNSSVEFNDSMIALISDMPDTIIELVFEYAKDLDRKKIESTATEYDISKAFTQMMGVAFPLAQNLVEAVKALSGKPSSSSSTSGISHPNT